MAEIRSELLEELLADYEKPEDLIGPDGLLKDLFKRLIETAAGAELTDHLGYERGDPAGRGSGSSRNGSTSKTLVSEHGDVAVDMPGDTEAARSQQRPRAQTADKHRPRRPDDFQHPANRACTEGPARRWRETR